MTLQASGRNLYPDGRTCLDLPPEERSNFMPPKVTRPSSQRNDDHPFGVLRRVHVQQASLDVTHEAAEGEGEGYLSRIRGCSHGLLLQAAIVASCDHSAPAMNERLQRAMTMSIMQTVLQGRGGC